MNIVRYSSSEWSEVAETMHLSVFNEFRPSDLNRIDFALVVWNDKIPMGYITCAEYDSKSIYIGYGGSLQKSFKNLFAYHMLLSYLKERYLRVNTLIENNNITMLKMALSSGFLVTGIRYFNGSIMLENSIEWGK